MANPPIPIGPFTNVPAPGSPIASAWAQQVTQYFSDAVRVYANQAAMLADPRPPANGAQAITTDNYALWVRRAGAWEIMWPRYVNNVNIATGGSYTATVADIPGASIAVPFVAGHRYLLGVTTHWQQSTSAGLVTVQITDAANAQIAAGVNSITAAFQGPVAFTAFVIPTGAVTYKLRASTSAGTAALVATNTFYILDMGP
jgi:hypothetical protein